MGRSRPKGYLSSYSAAGKEKRWLVGAKDDDDPKYQGPVAEVWADETWLYIETDKYEGSVMLNIEALPYLRRALSNLSKALPLQEKHTGE